MSLGYVREILFLAHEIKCLAHDIVFSKTKNWQRNLIYWSEHVLPITSMRSVLSLVPQPSEFLAAHWYTLPLSWSKSTRLMVSLGVYTSRELPVYFESDMLTSIWFLVHLVSSVGGKSVLLTTVHWITKFDKYGTSWCSNGVIVRRGVPFYKETWMSLKNV